MSTLKQVVGLANAEWHEDAPLRWTMTETLGKGKRAEVKEISFDLTPLLQCFGRDFLLAFKEHFIDRLLHVRLLSIKVEAYRIQAALQACQDHFVKDLQRAGHEAAFV